MSGIVLKLIGSAERHAQEGDAQKAAFDLNMAVKLGARHPSAKVAAAQIYEQIGHHTEAVELYLDAARLYIMNNQAVLALDTVKQLLAIDPDNYEAKHMLANAYARSTKPNEERLPAAPKAPSVRIELGPAQGHGGDDFMPEVTFEAPEVLDASADLTGAERARLGDFGVAVAETPETHVGPPPAQARGTAPAGRAPPKAPPGGIIPPSGPPAGPPPGRAPVPDAMHIPLFSQMSKNAFIETVTRLKHHEFGPGDTLMRQGEPGHSMFVLVTGQAKVTVQPEGREAIEVATLKDGDFCGEMALISREPRSATVTAVTPVTALELGVQELNEVIAKYPSVAKVLTAFYHERLRHNILHTNPLFSALPPHEARLILLQFKLLKAPAGTDFITQGERADGAYIILVGKAAALRDREGTSETVRTIGPGDVVGLRSLVHRLPSAVTVRMTGDGLVIKLAAKTFSELLMINPNFLEHTAALTETGAAV